MSSFRRVKKEHWVVDRMASLAQASIIESTFDNCTLFRAISTQISELAATVNIKVVPFHDKNLVHFSKLEGSHQLQILSSLEVYLSVYTTTQAEGGSILDSVRVVWNALMKLGYRPTSDLFSYICEGNVIEIHNSSFVQTFRNLAFFNYCSYSLEELYCFHLTQLYARDLTVEEDLMKYLKQIYSGEVKTVIKTNLKEHIITELSSKGRLQITDKIEFMAPLYESGGGRTPIATITIESASVNMTPAAFLPDFVELKPHASQDSDFSI